MLKQQTRLTKRQLRELKSIKKGPNQKLDIIAFCNKFGLQEKKVYNMWFYHTQVKKSRRSAKNTSLISTPVVSSSKDLLTAPKPFVSAKDLTAYTLVDATLGHGRGSKTGSEIILDKLKPLVDMLEINRYSVPFYKANRAIVRKWLSDVEKKAKKAFSVVPIRGNRLMLAIQRTA